MQTRNTIEIYPTNSLYHIISIFSHSYLLSFDSDLKEFVSNESNQDNFPSYEDWIRHCHPENTRDGIFIDHRKFYKTRLSSSSSECPGIDDCVVPFHLGFYVEKSDHRIAWNRLMKKRGKDYLVVKAQRPGHVRSNTF